MSSENQYSNKSKFTSSVRYRSGVKIAKWTAIIFAILFTLLLLLFTGAGIYFENNKTEIVADINKQINDNISGEASIGDVNYKFISTLPNFTLVLKNLELKDSLIAIHKRPVLKAGEVEVRLNVFSLLKKEISFNKIVINNAKIDLFKDKNGITNSNIFKSKPKNKKEKSSGASISIEKVSLNNVVFISENQNRNKLFHFEVATLNSTIDYSDEGWTTEVSISTLAKSMAFNLRKGSFIKDKVVKGVLKVAFLENKNKIKVSVDDLDIGEDSFNIKANFSLDKANQLFDIDINTNIKWTNAYKLLSDNIVRRLKFFDMRKTLKVRCVITGDLNSMGDPEIVVDAVVKDDILIIPDGKFDNCSFKGRFTNNYKNGLGNNDANSAVLISDFTAKYQGIPVIMPKANILNFDNPIAEGSIRSDFNVKNLNQALGNKTLDFVGGTGKIDLKYNVDIVNLRINKPHFTGLIDIQNAKLKFRQSNLDFVSNVKLRFVENDLNIDKISYVSKTSNFNINGKIADFLNLYYTNPEKMVANLDLNSSSLNIKEIISISAGKAEVKETNKKTSKSGMGMEQVFKNSRITFHTSVDKVFFGAFVARKAKFDILVHNNQLFVEKGGFMASGGNIQFSGKMIPSAKNYLFDTSVNVSKVNISQFLKSFNNFGIKSFQPEDIKGTLTLNSSIKGGMTPSGTLVDNSVNGNVDFFVSNGALVNFEPIIKVGKIAFPKRGVNNIAFSDIIGNMNIEGEKVKINKMRVSSSVLNFDLVGIYSFEKGTNLGLTIPLRNPVNDMKEKDLQKREALRNTGVVLRLLAFDGPDGKIKIKFGNYVPAK
ncbi:MAG: AsmA-like C-terminal region-containing protein [Flavobacterium sp.]